MLTCEESYDIHGNLPGLICMRLTELPSAVILDMVGLKADINCLMAM